MNNTDRFFVVFFVMALSVFASVANPGQYEGYFVDSDGAHHHTAVRQYEISPIEILSYLHRYEKSTLADQTIHHIIPPNATPHTGMAFEADTFGAILLVTAVSGVIVAISMRIIPVRTVATNDAGACRYENRFAESFGRFVYVYPHKLGSKVPGIFMVLFFILFLFSYFLPESYAILDSTEIIDHTDIPVLTGGDSFGTSVAGIGDLDGDGVDDIVVGATGDDGVLSNAGAIYVLFMNPDGSIKDTVEINGGTENGPELSTSDEFGSAVASIGDLDRDGVGDIAVGADRDNGVAQNTGAVHILFMNPDGSVKRTVEINDETGNGPELSEGDEFGNAVAGIGDLDGDGVVDIAVGADLDRGAAQSTGAVHIMFMNTDGSVKRTVEIDDGTENGPDLSPDDRFGTSVAGIGDLDRDGVGDIAVGAFGVDGFTGAVHILFMNRDGSIKGTVEINDGTENGPELSSFDFFGASTADVGDLNGDGVGDIIVGAYGDNGVIRTTGAIHILFMNTDGSIKETIKINDMTSNAPVLSTGKLFGFSAANIGDLNGDGIGDIAVGTPLEDGSDGSTNVGVVHIIYLDILPTNGNGRVDGSIEIGGNIENGPVLFVDDNFGASVASIGDLDGDDIEDIAVGASGDNGQGTDTGAIHILFMNADGSVKRTAEINDRTVNGPVLSADDLFGRAIAGIGDLDGDDVMDIAVGALADDGVVENTGAIHILFMNTNGSVKQTAEINDQTANGPVLSANDFFGTSVAGIGDLDGDDVIDIVVGASGDDSRSSSNGAIHILFMNADGSVKRTAEINGETPNSPGLFNGDEFGTSVAGIGDLDGDDVIDIVVGEAGNNTNAQNTGTIHILFMNPDGSIKSRAEVSDRTENGPTLSSFDGFGISVAVIGDLDGDDIYDIAVGAIGDDLGGTDIGAIHILFMNADGSVKRTAEINSETANGPVLSGNDIFGTSVAGIGDFDGDGVVDITIGAPMDDGATQNSGAIHILFMNPNGSIKRTVEINDRTESGPVLLPNDLFGRAVAGIGDLNRDGTGDIVVGASGDDGVGSDTGAIHILFMNPDGSLARVSPEINDMTINSLELSAFDNFGMSVAGIGDLNRDGIVDITVGAPRDDGAVINTGAIHILFMNLGGSIRETVEINDQTVNGPELSAFDEFGMSVASVNDLDGDGVGDIAVGASGDNGQGADAGAVHILFMNADGSIKRTAEINDETANGPALSTNDLFGTSVAGIGDLDGDGIYDIVVGASGDSSATGAIYILFMNADGSIKRTAGINSETANGPALSSDDSFGASVAGIGDLDGDGTYDIAVGASGNGGAIGAIYILFMSPDGSIKRTAEINSETANGPALSSDDSFGTSVAGIGDLDRDGIDDIVAGSQTISTAGAIYIINLDKHTVAQSVSSTNRDGIYRTDEIIDITVSFSEPVDIEGNPYILLETGAIDRMAGYFSGNGTETITFRYLIMEGDDSDDLEYVAGSQLMLNGGTIKASESPNEDAILALPPTNTFFEFTPVDAFGSLGLNKDLVINLVIPLSDSVAPTDNTAISLSISTSDSVAPDDMVGGMGAASITDSITPNDDITISRSISVLDSVAPDDMVGGMGSASVSDSVAPDDGITAALSVSVLDSVAPDDMVGGMGSISVTDSVVPTDTVSGMGMVSESDSVTPDDGITAALSVFVSDSVTPDDMVGGMGSISVTDSVVPTDTVSGMGSASVSDSVAPTDRTIAALSISLLDSVAPDDMVGGMGSISVTDSVVPTDTVSGMGMVSESDSVTPDDGITAALSISVSDSVAPDDMVGGMGSISVTDSVVPTDMVSGMGMVSESDFVTPNDSTTAALSVSLLDSVAPNDIVGGMGSISVTDSVVSADNADMMFSASLSALDSIVPADSISGMGSLIASDSVVPSDGIDMLLSVSLSASDSVTPADMTGAPPEPEPIPVPAPEPEQIRSSAPRTSSGGTGFALAPALMLYDRCDGKNELVVIGATYGENLQATISSGDTYIAGNDITSNTNFANYIEHHNIPVNLHAFEFEGAPHAIDAITVHDDKKEYTVPASFGNTCNGHTILYEPLSVMFKTHIEFGSRYGLVQSQDVDGAESVKPDVRSDVTTPDEEAIVSESVATDPEPAEVDPEPLVSESVRTDPEPTVSESVGTDPEPEEVDPEPAPTQRPIWESVMEFFAGLIP